MFERIRRQNDTNGWPRAYDPKLRPPFLTGKVIKRIKVAVEEDNKEEKNTRLTTIDIPSTGPTVGQLTRHGGLVEVAEQDVAQHDVPADSRGEQLTRHGSRQESEQLPRHGGLSDPGRLIPIN